MLILTARDGFLDLVKLGSDGYEILAAEEAGFLEVVE